jgi:hypothetical protein
VTAVAEEEAVAPASRHLPAFAHDACRGSDPTLPLFMHKGGSGDATRATEGKPHKGMVLIGTTTSTATRGNKFGVLS